MTIIFYLSRANLQDGYKSYFKGNKYCFENIRPHIEYCSQARASVLRDGN